MKEEKRNQPVKLEIQLDDDTAQGVYANLALVNHNDGEFTLDFIYVQPQAPKAKVRSRVVISPQHAKRLAQALHENISNYEHHFGPIATGAGPQQQVEEGEYH